MSEYVVKSEPCPSPMLPSEVPACLDGTDYPCVGCLGNGERLVVSSAIPVEGEFHNLGSSSSTWVWVEVDR